MAQIEEALFSEPELEEDPWESEPVVLADEGNTPDTQTQEPTLPSLLKGIDIETLQLRPVRKICGRLGIQQKVNGKDAPLSWLRGKIKQRLEESPVESVPIILEVLSAA
jgi:hypothetical protein